jgi:hypothetical protein
MSKHEKYENRCQRIYINFSTMDIRDFASAEELVVLINLEDTNADLIRQEVTQMERLKCPHLYEFIWR